jgi:uncharacterized membrane protein
VRKWYAPVLLVLSIILSAIAYPSLPDRIPVHWSLFGEVNRYGSRFEAAFILPFIGIVFWLAMRALPRVDPLRENYARFQDTYELIVNTMVTLLVAMHLALIGSALGYPIPLSRVFPALVGVALVVLGNVLPRARPNWWFGIRTPWTLSNERVWTKTHRVGGYLFVAAGIAWVIVALMPSSSATHPILLVTLVVAALASFVYSYFAWRQEHS